MRKVPHLLAFIFLLSHLWGFIPTAEAVFNEYEKIIWINQLRQNGAAYEHGKKLFEFPILSGDDETTTDPGIYVIKLKEEDYYSRKYDTPMPYSLFFDLKQRKAIHEGEVPAPGERRDYATHGCIHVESPYIEKLFEWAETGKTVVVIYGWREEE